MSSRSPVNSLHFDDLRGDIYVGLTGAVVALPLALTLAALGSIDTHRAPGCSSSWSAADSPMR